MTFMSVVTLFFCMFSTLALADSASTFTLPSDVRVTIVEAAFHEENFTIDGCSAKSPICFINGKLPYGLAFGLPKTYIKSVTIFYQGTSYALDGTNMYNAWGNRPLEYPGAVRYFGGGCVDKKNCQFRGLFSDAAGAYVAEWLIVEGYAIRTVLTNSIDVVNLFTKNIDPPVFD